MRNIDYFGKLFLIAAFVYFLARLFLAQFLTYNLDLDTFKSWSYYLADHPLKDFYSNVWSDYLPGYHYILWILGKIRFLLIQNSIMLDENVFYKLPSLISDIGNALFIFLICKKFTKPKNAFFAALIYLTNPAILANSTFWGQVDSFVSFFLLSSFFFLLEKKYWLSALLISYGIITKPIAILSVPVYLLFIFFSESSYQRFYKPVISLIIILSTAIISFIPFNYSPNLFLFINERFQQTFNQYTYTSLNAFNFWSFVSDFWISDKINFLGISYQDWGQLLLFLIYTLLMLTLILRFKYIKNKALFLSFILSLAYLAMFLFLTRIHERHLFYALSLLTLILPVVNNFAAITIFILYSIYILNLNFAYLQLIQKPLGWDHNVIIFISSINLVAFIYLMICFFNKFLKNENT